MSPGDFRPVCDLWSKFGPTTLTLKRLSTTTTLWGSGWVEETDGYPCLIELPPPHVKVKVSKVCFSVFLLFTLVGLSSSPGKTAVGLHKTSRPWLPEGINK